MLILYIRICNWLKLQKGGFRGSIGKDFVTRIMKHQSKLPQQTLEKQKSVENDTV